MAEMLVVRSGDCMVEALGYNEVVLSARLLAYEKVACLGY